MADDAQMGEEYEEVFGSGSSEEEEAYEDDYDDGGGEIEGLRGRVGKVERETHDDGDGFVDDTEGIR